MPRYVYKESAPALSGKAREFGMSYRRMAVLEIEDGFDGDPKMISERARGVKRIVEETTASVGKTDRSWGFRERARLLQLAKDMNDAAR